MNRLDLRTEPEPVSVLDLPWTFDPQLQLLDLLDDIGPEDDLSPVRGLVAGVLLSLPVWAGVG
ncbi:MAG TPA: hypothetical protein VIY72_02445 [Acidimicrobiales bacterium]